MWMNVWWQSNLKSQSSLLWLRPWKSVCSVECKSHTYKSRPSPLLLTTETVQSVQLSGIFMYLLLLLQFKYHHTVNYEGICFKQATDLIIWCEDATVPTAVHPSVTPCMLFLPAFSPSSSAFIFSSPPQ